MLYLLLPDLTMQRSALRVAPLIKASGADNLDLSFLSLEPSGRPVTTDALRWALRHGIPCSSGLLLDGPGLSVAYTPDELKRAFAEFQQSGIPLPDGVAESFSGALAEAQEELDEDLTVEPNQDAVRRWRALGGPIPSPI